MYKSIFVTFMYQTFETFMKISFRKSYGDFYRIISIFHHEYGIGYVKIMLELFVL